MRRPEIVDRIRKAVATYPDNVKVWLYGSEARGDARHDSDIDLLVLVDKDRVSHDDRMTLIDPLMEIELETGILINPFFQTKKAWGSRYTPFYENVTRDRIAL